MERRAGTLIAVLLTGIIGCAAEVAPGGLAGPDLALAWTVEPLFEVGGADAPTWAAFGDVAQVSFDELGRLYVLDRSSRQVAIVDVDGSFVGTVGRPGDGPGEFASPSAFARDQEGVLIVFDQIRRGFALFDSLGGYAGSVALDPDRPAPVGPLGIDAAGRVFSLRDDQLPEAGVEAPPRRTLTLHSLTPGGGADVIYSGWTPRTPDVRELTPEETGGMRVRLPPLVGFHPALHATALLDGRLAVVDSTDYRVRLVGPNGVVSELTRPIEPRPVDSALRERERERRTRLLQDTPPQLVRSTADGAQTGVANDAVLRLGLARIDGMGFHDVVPVVDRLGTDRAGNLWIQRTGVSPDRPGPVDVVHPDGEYLGTLSEPMRLPDAFGPDGRVAHITMDDFGAPRIDVGRLVTAEGAVPGR